MTTRKIYRCNFCGVENEDAEQFHGLYWFGGEKLEKRNSFDCENHLCQSCLTEIGRIAREHEGPVALSSSKSVLIGSETFDEGQP